MSNNPTMDLLTEIAEYNIAQRAVDKDTEVVEPTVCLSLGTGVPPVKKVSQFFESSLLILKNHNFVNLKIAFILPQIDQSINEKNFCNHCQLWANYIMIDCIHIFKIIYLFRQP